MFLGYYNLPLIPIERGWYHSESYCNIKQGYGDNIMWLNSSYLDNLMDTYESSPDYMVRLQSLNDIQKFLYNNVIAFPILQEKSLYAFT